MQSKSKSLRKRSLRVEELECRRVLATLAIPSSVEITDTGRTFEFSATQGTLYHFNAGDVSEGIRLEIRQPGEHFPSEMKPTDLNWMAPADGLYALNVFGGTDSYQLNANTIEFDDDHGIGNDSTPASIPFSSIGRIDVLGDMDDLAFSADAGEVYEFEFGFEAVGFASLMNSNGDAEFYSNGRTLIRWMAPEDGDYNLRFEGNSFADFGIGNYNVEVRQISFEDDFANVAADANIVSAPSTTTGTLDFDGDTDFVAFDATVGVVYEFASTNGIPLDLYGTDGSTVLESADGSPISWAAPKSGVYFIAAGGEISGTDGPEIDYTVDIGIPLYDDDHSNRPANATAVVVDSTNTGAFEIDGDLDWFSFEATEGTDYLISTPNDLEAAPELTLFDSLGGDVLANATTRLGQPSYIGWTAFTTGRYLIRAQQGQGSGSGEYVVSVAESFDDHGDDFDDATRMPMPFSTTGFLGGARDADVYSFPVEAGRLYRVDSNASMYVYSDEQVFVEGSSFHTSVYFCSPSDATYYVRSFGSPGDYQLSVDDVEYADDHGNSIDAATPLADAVSMDGSLEEFGDADYFSFETIENARYRFSTSSPQFTFRPLINVFAAGDETNGGSGSEEFVAPSSGTYYVRVGSHHFPSMGDYTLEIETTVYEDDHGSHPITATPIAVPSTTNGTIELPVDRDVFEFTATAGRLYNIEAASEEGIRMSVGVLDSDGRNLVGSSSRQSGAANLVHWIAPESGSYYLQVSASQPDVDYSSSIEEVSYVDDYPSVLADAASVDIPLTISGSIEVDGDVDVFSFDFERNTRYVITDTADFASEMVVYSNGRKMFLGVDQGKLLPIDWIPRWEETVQLSFVDVVDGEFGEYSIDFQRFVAGDTDLDGDVDSDDLGRLLNQFGKPGGDEWESGDFDRNRQTDSADLGLLLNNFGKGEVAAEPTVERVDRLPRAADPTSHKQTVVDKPVVSAPAAEGSAVRHAVFSLRDLVFGEYGEDDGEPSHRDLPQRFRIGVVSK